MDTPITAKPVVIVPTVGRIVWYRPSQRDIEAGMVRLPEEPGDEFQPLKAEVVYVHKDGRINTLVTDHMGRQFARHGVTVVQDEQPAPTLHDGQADAYVEWMPYQKKTATAGSS